ncbi:MAG: adenosylcobinamide amidohydrolase [Methanobrevibacter sp.]|nr:adenosylcobinamide amidohydrolase [Methanobrevibacter sp.]
MTKDGDFELIFETCDGDKVLRDESNVLVRFAQKRNGIVTSWINAGYREDLEAVFNHQLSQDTLDEEESEEIEIFDYLKGLSHEMASSLDLDENRISGLVTSAKMTNVGISTERFRKLEVTAISTAGTNVNAGSAGDPASYYEENGHFDLNINQSDGGQVVGDDDDGVLPEKPGTINSIILINACLDESSILLAEMTAVEAKTVALRDLMIPSCYSNEVATGTGTDGIAIFSNMESENHVEIAGKHSKLGEMIAKTVIDSIKIALEKQIWLTPSYQSNALVRLERYRTDLDDFYNDYLGLDECQKQEFIKSLIEVDKNPELIGYVSLVLSILDQFRSGLISKNAASVVIGSLFDNQFNKAQWHNMRTLVEYIVKINLGDI